MTDSERTDRQPHSKTLNPPGMGVKSQTECSSVHVLVGEIGLLEQLSCGSQRVLALQTTSTAAAPDQPLGSTYPSSHATHALSRNAPDIDDVMLESSSHKSSHG